jgi:hypothetical protein
MTSSATVCFITAIYGNYESFCKKYAVQTIPTDFICFTDNNTIINNGWIIDPIPYHIINKSPIDNSNYVNSIVNNEHSFNIAKYYKQAFQNIPRLKKYEVVVWIDGTIELTNINVSKWIMDNISTNKIIAWEHSEQITMPETIVITSKMLRYNSTFWANQKQPHQDVINHYKTYIEEDFNLVNMKPFITCFIAYLNKDEQVSHFLDLYYYQTLKYTTQDELSFIYVCNKLNMFPYKLPNQEIKSVDTNIITDFYIKFNHG